MWSPLPTQIGTALPQLSPLWGNLHFQACQTWFRKGWLQLWHKEMVCKYKLKPWGFDWCCWKAATLCIQCTKNLRFPITPSKVRTLLQLVLPQQNFDSWVRQESQVWIPAPSSFPPKSIPDCEWIWLWMFISLTAVIAHCIPVLKSLQFGECLSLVQPYLLDPWYTAESKVPALICTMKMYFGTKMHTYGEGFLTYITVCNFAA